MENNKNPKKRIWNRFICGLFILVLAVGFLPVNTQVVFGAEQNTAATENIISQNNKASDIFALDKEAPSELDEMPDDVYGVDADEVDDGAQNNNQPFLLSEQNELWMTVTDTTAGTKGYKFNNLDMTITKGDVENETDELWVDGVNVAHDKSATINTDKVAIYDVMHFAQGVGLDADGTGKREYTAQVGMSNGQIMVAIQNVKTLGYLKTVTLGSAEWMKSQNKLWMMDNYFAITAGDYDGDGKDSIIVYACGDKDGARLVELTKKSDGGWDKTTITKISDLTTFKKFKTDNSYKYRPVVSLATGDFDGDNREEFAYSAGFYNTSDNAAKGYVDYSCSTFEEFATTVGVYDESSGSWIKSKPLWMYDKLSANKISQSGSTAIYRIPIMYGGSIAAGDTDNDGLDEIIAAGYTSENDKKGTYTKATYVSGNLSKVDNVCNWDPDNRINAVIKYNGSGYSRSNLKTMGISTYEKTIYGALVDNRFVMPQIAMECGKTNGCNAPEDVFISGILYDFSGSTPSVKYTPEIMKNNVIYLTGGTTTFSECNWVRNVAVGNFDQNDAGREQFVYTIWGKANGSEKYSSNVGIMGGVGFQDETDDVDGHITNYVQTDRYANNLNAADMIKGNYPIHGNNAGATQLTKAAQSNAESAAGVVSAVPIAVDTDNDGLLAKYRSKGYVYTDPEVLAVIQGGPFFTELDEDGGYSDPCETSYSITTGYGNGTSTSDSVGLEVGFTAEAANPGLRVSFELGYAMEWSHSYETSYDVEETVTFTAQEEDVVALSRVPQLVYNYDIYDAANNRWIESGYSVRVPMKACYFLLGIDEYNEFVEEFNEIVEKAGGTNTLNKIDEGTDLPAGHVGYPDNYWHKWAEAGDGADALVGGFTALGYASGNISREKVVSETQTDTVEQSHGFHHSITVQGGAEYAVGEAWAGGYENFDYKHSTGCSKTRMNAKGTAGQVENVRENVLMKLKENPYTQDQVRAYAFQWQLGTWSRPLQNDGPDVPFIGYITQNVTRPEGSPGIAGPAKTRVVEGYEATTSSPFNAIGNPEPTVKKAYGRDELEYNSVNKRLEIGSGLPLGTYKVNLQASNKYGNASMDSYVIVGKCADRKIAEAVSKAIRNMDIESVQGLFYNEENAPEIQAVEKVIQKYEALTEAQKAYLSEAEAQKISCAKEYMAMEKSKAKHLDAAVDLQGHYDYDLQNLEQDVARLYQDVMDMSPEERQELKDAILDNDYQWYMQAYRNIYSEQIFATDLEAVGLSVDMDRSKWEQAIQRLRSIDKKLVVVYDLLAGKDAEAVANERWESRPAADFERDFENLDEGIDQLTYSDAENYLNLIKTMTNAYFDMDDSVRALLFSPFEEDVPNRLIDAQQRFYEKYADLMGERRWQIVSQSEQATASMNTAAVIANLPKEDALTITDKAAVNEAVAMYNNLSSEEKALLNEETLVWLENAKSNLQDRINAVVDISKKGKVANIPTKKVYTGKAFKPEPDISVNGKYLKKGKDYTVTYKNNKNVGKATVTIKGINNYKGTITKTFKINPKGTTLAKVTPNKKGFTVKWKKQAAKMSTSRITGYRIQYSTKSNFKSGTKTIKVKGYAKFSKKVGKLKAKKKYFVRVQTYKVVNGVTYYSAWSKAKAVKTKK